MRFKKALQMVLSQKGIMFAESAAAGEGAAWAYALLAVAHGGLVLPAVLAPCQVIPCIWIQEKYAREKGGLFWKRHMRVKVHAHYITKAPSFQTFLHSRCRHAYRRICSL